MRCSFPILDSRIPLRQDLDEDSFSAVSGQMYIPFDIDSRKHCRSGHIWTRLLTQSFGLEPVVIGFSLLWPLHLWPHVFTFPSGVTFGSV